MLARAWHRVPPLVVDVLLAAVVLVIGLVEAQPRAQAYNGANDGYQVGPHAWNVVVVVCFALPFVFRRIAPGPSFLLVHVGFFALAVVHDHSSYFFANSLPSMLSVYSVTRYGQGWLTRWAWLVAPATFTGALVFGAPTAVLHYEASAPVSYLVCAVVPWLIGRILRRLAEQGVELDTALAELATQQAQRQAAAVTAERARIAVEMHDVIDHAVHLMINQIGAARTELEHHPIDVSRLWAAEQTGHQALVELDRTLGVLRDRGGARERAAPIPGLADTGDLVEAFRAAGLDVRLDLDHVDGLSPSVQLAAYRIVQEALTNALKYGDKTWAAAAVLANGRELTVTVRNPIGKSPIAPVVPSGRHGLVGMRERVAMFSGSLRAGPAAGGFEIRAVLPLPPGDDMIQAVG